MSCFKSLEVLQFSFANISQVHRSVTELNSHSVSSYRAGPSSMPAVLVPVPGCLHGMTHRAKLNGSPQTQIPCQCYMSPLRAGCRPAASQAHFSALQCCFPTLQETWGHNSLH